MTTTTASVSSVPSPKAPAAASSEAPGRRFTVGKALAWAAMILIMLFTLLPFYWVLRTALSSNAGITAHPTSLLPVDINLRGFARVFGMQSTEEALADGGSGAAINFWLYLRNSVIISTLVTVGQVFFSAMAAYSFSRLRWRGRDTVFAVVMLVCNGIVGSRLRAVLDVGRVIADDAGIAADRVAAGDHHDPGGASGRAARAPQRPRSPGRIQLVVATP